MTEARQDMDKTHQRETLKAALEVWQFQVDSYWSRNSYFVTFHTAIMAAVWEITKNKDLGDSRKLAAECFCVAGMFLAVLWLVNNIRVHQYILYWWKRATPARTKRRTKDKSSWTPATFQQKEQTTRRTSWTPTSGPHKGGHSKPAKWSPDDPRRKKKKPRHTYQKEQERQHSYKAPHLAHYQPKHPSAERMGSGELYEYYKRQGLLEVYFRMFPNG